MSNIDINKLKQYVDAIEKYEIQKEQINENIKEILDNAKSNGFDVKIIRQIIRMKNKMRKTDSETLETQKYLLEIYKEALGIQD